MNKHLLEMYANLVIETQEIQDGDVKKLAEGILVLVKNYDNQAKEIERQKEIIRQLDIKNLELTTIINKLEECMRSDDGWDVENILNYLQELKVNNGEKHKIEEYKKDEEIEIYVNGEKVDITDIYEPLKQGEYIYKENNKWYIHRLKYITKVMNNERTY